jgi:hypothetical protein
MRLLRLALPVAALLAAPLAAQETFDGLARPETFAALAREDALDQPGEPHREKGQGRMATEALAPGRARAGQGWKVSPSVRTAKTTFNCDVAGQGAIQHIWMT